MSRLMCFGDSFTFGHGLPDTQDTFDDQGNCIVVQHPSKYAWPSLLSQIRGQELVNAGSTGASNKEIWHMIMSTHFNTSDDVVIMWSHHHRTCKIIEWPSAPQLDKFVWEPRSEAKFWNETIKSYGNWMEDDSAVMGYYQHYYEESDSELTSLLYMNHVELYLTPRVRTVTHALIPNSHLDNHRHNPVHWDVINYNRFYDSSIVYMSNEKTECGHMGKNANRQVAQDIHQLILDKTS